MSVDGLGAGFTAVPLWSHERTRGGRAEEFAGSNVLDGTFVALVIDALGWPLDRCRSWV